MTSGHVFHRFTHAPPPTAVRGEGIYLFDADGRRYVDACGGAAVSCLGHGHPEIIAAVAKQTAQLEFIHTGFFTTDAAEELAATMAEMSPGSLNRVWFTGSGSEAIEAALKLARQFHLERGDSRRSRIIARRQSYHGNTLGALAAVAAYGVTAGFGSSTSSPGAYRATSSLLVADTRTEQTLNIGPFHLRGAVAPSAACRHPAAGLR